MLSPRAGKTEAFGEVAGALVASFRPGGSFLEEQVAGGGVDDADIAGETVPRGALSYGGADFCSADDWSCGQRGKQAKYTSYIATFFSWT